MSHQERFIFVYYNYKYDCNMEMKRAEGNVQIIQGHVREGFCKAQKKRWTKLN